MSEPVIVAEFDMKLVQKEDITRVDPDRFVNMSKDGNVDGIAVWFDAVFDPKIDAGEYEKTFAKVGLKTGPCDQETHWKQAVLVLCGEVYEDSNSDDSGTEVVLGGSVSEGEIIGWCLTMAQSVSNARHYSLGFEALHPFKQYHPVPCGCKMERCSLMKAEYENKRGNLKVV